MHLTVAPVYAKSDANWPFITLPIRVIYAAKLFAVLGRREAQVSVITLVVSASSRREERFEAALERQGGAFDSSLLGPKLCPNAETTTAEYLAARSISVLNGADQTIDNTYAHRTREMLTFDYLPCLRKPHINLSNIFLRCV